MTVIIDRVRAADAEAEAWWAQVSAPGETWTKEWKTALALIAIAAELRAARIARTPVETEE